MAWKKLLAALFLVALGMTLARAQIVTGGGGGGGGVGAVVCSVTVTSATSVALDASNGCNNIATAWRVYRLTFTNINSIGTATFNFKQTGSDSYDTSSNYVSLIMYTCGGTPTQSALASQTAISLQSGLTLVTNVTFANLSSSNTDKGAMWELSDQGSGSLCRTVGAGNYNFGTAANTISGILVTFQDAVSTTITLIGEP
jgi:hypothetical protein